jgi:hypothetical protein
MWRVLDTICLLPTWEPGDNYNKTDSVLSRDTEARSCNHCCLTKSVNVTYSEYISVALVIQHAIRMRRIILSSVASLATPYFPTFSNKRRHFRKKFIENKFFFPTTYV